MKDYTERNINLITEYFSKGCKNSTWGKIGVELEHFIVDRSNKTAVSYYGKGGVEEILRNISPNFKKEICESGRLLALEGESYSISTEPGGQIEISINPQREIDGIKKIYQDFTRLITPVLDSFGYSLENVGYHPFEKCGDIQLIPKNRYRVMDDFFSLSGIMGINMMRATASAQVNIDYFSQDDFTQKYALANLISPIVYLICDNSPVFQGKPNYLSCIRSKIWRNVDKRCCSMPVKEDFESFEFKDYAGYIYDSLPLFDSDGRRVSYTMTNRDYYSEKEVDSLDIEHMLSMVFPDVRIKNYIELRMADSMDIDYVLSYAAFVKGLFYGADSVKAGLALFGGSTPMDVESAKLSVEKEGFNCKVYNTDVRKIIENLFNIAERGLDGQEKEYLAPLKNDALNLRNLRLKNTKNKRE